MNNKTQLAWLAALCSFIFFAVQVIGMPSKKNVHETVTMDDGSVCDIINRNKVECFQSAVRIEDGKSKALRVLRGEK